MYSESYQGIGTGDTARRMWSQMSVQAVSLTTASCGQPPPLGWGGDPFAALQVDSDEWETSKGPHGTDTLDMTCGVSDWGAIHLRHRERDEREAGQSGSRSGG